ncbi:hypothetical protein OQJ62_10410 [Microbulbifer thermotolerans]|nr:hypothetical protein [Microbulbifer thermotolerans]MCX2795331.1 hypothetical protein [Microbulbifer thermotolerans]
MDFSNTSMTDLVSLIARHLADHGIGMVLVVGLAVALHKTPYGKIMSF